MAESPVPRCKGPGAPNLCFFAGFAGTETSHPFHDEAVKWMGHQSVGDEKG